VFKDGVKKRPILLDMNMKLGNGHIFVLYNNIADIAGIRSVIMLERTILLVQDYGQLSIPTYGVYEPV